MSKTIIVLGNGFDLDLGLMTRYSDFSKSSQWNELMASNAHSQSDSLLLGFLKSKYEVNQWMDLEAALLEFAVLKTNNRDLNHTKEDEEDFHALCRALKAYLQEQQVSFIPSRHSVALALLNFLGHLSKESCLYSFNYTQLDILSQKFNLNSVQDAVHIHGSLGEEDDIILGIETRERIDSNYAFLFKTQNRHYSHTNLIKDLRRKDEYVFFGHSLNGMDYPYFESAFIQMANTGMNTPHLTIISKDKSSENNFKIFLRNKGISLPELYSNSDPVFILTDEVYKREKTELQKVAEFFDRARFM